MSSAGADARNDALAAGGCGAVGSRGLPADRTPNRVVGLGVNLQHAKAKDSFRDVDNRAACEALEREHWPSARPDPGRPARRDIPDSFGGAVRRYDEDSDLGRSTGGGGMG